MAAININANFADGGDVGSGPFTLVVKRGATAPADGTAIFTGSSDTVRNLHMLFEQAYEQAMGYIIGQNETDALN